MNTSRSHPSIPLNQFSIKESEPQACDEQSVAPLSAEYWIEEAKRVESVYIHVPFCFHKCHYCDFYSIVGAEDTYELFLKRLDSELQFVGQNLDGIKTIFIGGGTPTIFDIPLFEGLLESVAKHIPRADDCEWTIEANPETVTPEKAEAMVRCGVNRVSIGAQSFDVNLLKALERWHDPKSVAHAVEQVTAAGIQDVSLDLIYAIPTQTQTQLEDDLRKAVALNPTHLSCYSLIYEPNTPLRVRLDRGFVRRVDHEVEASMFDTVMKVLRSRGYEQYEISNFAKRGYECNHNIAYWTNQSWWPFGPSASGHLDGRRWKNTPRISEYVGSHRMPPIVDVEVLDDDRSAGESFMVGLRLIKGMERNWVERLINQSNNEWRRDVIEHYIDIGMLHWQKDRLAFTAPGLCMADTVILALLMQDDSITDT